MSVDKFGRYEHKQAEPSESVPKTTAGDYDIQDKHLRNVKEPVNDKDAATKGFVLKSVLPKDKKGDYNFNGKRIKNLGEPVNSNDGATKQFVERVSLKRSHPDRHIDLEGKLIRNVGIPQKDSDVATKKYVTSIIPEYHEDHWGFYNKRLSNVKSPVYEQEAVNLATLRSLTVSRPTTGEQFYDSNNMRITNVGYCERQEDAANRMFVMNYVNKANRGTEDQLRRLAAALFLYIHRASGRSAEQDVNKDNYIDLGYILTGERENAA